MEVTKKYDENLPCLTQVRMLEKGERIAFPMRMLINIRANLAPYGLMLNRKYVSHINREDNTIEVTREE